MPHSSSSSLLCAVPRSLLTPLLVLTLGACGGAPDETSATVATARAVRGAVETAMLPGCGHVPHQQARDATLARMTRFIAGHLPG